MSDIRKIFVFDFYPWDFKDEPKNDKRGFTISFKSMQDLAKFEYWMEEDDWYDFLSDMESYGVHDHSTSGFKEIVGYTTYEIRMHERDEVMEKWREHFIAHGYECGPVITGLDINDDDYPDMNLDNTDSLKLMEEMYFPANKGV